MGGGGGSRIHCKQKHLILEQLLTFNNPPTAPITPIIAIDHSVRLAGLTRLTIYYMYI